MEDLQTETTGNGVTILTLNRPDSLNALDAGLMRNFFQAVSQAAGDDNTRCLVVTGAGGAFCSGGDVKAISKAAKDREAAGKQGGVPKKSSLENRARWLRKYAETSRLLHEMPKPTIAMIHGACAGAGMSIAAACDFRFAAQTSRFVSAFVPHGVSGDYGGSWLWTRILGPAKARQLYLLGDRYDSAQALEFGLVDKVFADGELRQQTLEVAERLAGYPGSGIAYAKANLNNALTDSFHQSLDRESLNMMLARNAFIESRRQ